jgi:hypothetical protein
VVSPEPDTLEAILTQVWASLKAFYWHMTPTGWLPLHQEKIDALAQYTAHCTALGKSWRTLEEMLSTSEAFQLALREANPSLEPPASPPAPAPVATGTIAEQIVQVLRGAPDGLKNPAIATALGKTLTDTFAPLKRLIKRGLVRKDGVTYVLVEQKETP